MTIGINGYNIYGTGASNVGSSQKDDESGKVQPGSDKSSNGGSSIKSAIEALKKRLEAKKSEID